MLSFGLFCLCVLTLGTFVYSLMAVDDEALHSPAQKAWGVAAAVSGFMFLVVLVAFLGSVSPDMDDTQYCKITVSGLEGQPALQSAIAQKVAEQAASTAVAAGM